MAAQIIGSENHKMLVQMTPVPFKFCSGHNPEGYVSCEDLPSVHCILMNRSMMKMPQCSGVVAMHDVWLELNVCMHGPYVYMCMHNCNPYA